MPYIADAYREAVRFTECHCDNPDMEYAEFSPSFVQQSEDDCLNFLEALGDLAEALDNAGHTPERIGHDFWLTRNGHGAGFWDRGLGELGAKVTDLAHSFGSVDCYAGDDGLIYA